MPRYTATRSDVIFTNAYEGASDNQWRRQGGGGGGGVPGALAPLGQAPAQQKLICTNTNGGTSAVSLVTGFYKAERWLTYVSR